MDRYSEITRFSNGARHNNHCQVSACAEFQDTGRQIGETTKEVTTDIGHATRDATHAIGHASRDAVNSVKDDLSED